jgi:hypothetical protein
MIISKRILIPAVAATVIAGGIGLYGAHNLALADSSQSSHETLAQTIASAFGLDATKVQGVISQYRQGQQTQRADNYAQRLQAAVTAGKLTQTQEQAILAEHNTLAAELQTAQGQTGSARRTALQKVQSDAQAWATANNIEVRWLLGPGRPRLRGGRGPIPSPTASPAA